MRTNEQLFLAKRELVWWMNDHVGYQHVFVDDTLFLLVRRFGFSLKIARQALLETLSVYEGDKIVCWQVSEGLIDAFNRCGQGGRQRCLDWGALRVGSRGWTTTYSIIKELPLPQPPPRARRDVVFERTRSLEHRITFSISRRADKAATIEDMARYAEARVEENPDGTVTLIRNKRFSYNIIDRANSFGWHHVERGDVR